MLHVGYSDVDYKVPCRHAGAIENLRSVIKGQSTQNKPETNFSQLFPPLR